MALRVCVVPFSSGLAELPAARALALFACLLLICLFVQGCSGNMVCYIVLQSIKEDLKLTIKNLSSFNFREIQNRIHLQGTVTEFY